jgi:glycosyltransferase involved in cell wall biosynthesis
MPKVSVIIPCYNQGEYIEEAINSVLAQTFKDYEIIIINDGSTDKKTNLILSNLRVKHATLISTPNRGLSGARNNGIKKARGEYILPLDADDRIDPTYLEKASKLLDRDPLLKIVYCKAFTFGERKGSWKLPEYSHKKMLFRNLIFCSALFRKKDWKEVGGYSPKMSGGWEDWDFWLSLIERGGKVKCIQEVLFYYRLTKDSMTKSMNKESRINMHMELMRNHQNLYIDNSRPLIELYYTITGSLAYKILKKIRSGFRK